MSADYLRLKGVSGGVGKPLVSRQIKENVIDFFNWGFIDAGGFININLNTPGTYGGDKSQLRLVQDPRYGFGQIWEGFANEWVWQSGIADFAGPIAISGVWVNSTFFPNSTSGAFSFYINYRDGQIVFNSPISINSIVQCEYSYKWVRFVDAENAWFRQLVTKLDRVDNLEFLSPSSGNFNTLAQSRVGLPAVGVKMASRTYFTPMQLGGGHYLHKDLTFNILAEDEDIRNQIVDLITYQVDKTIIMYDFNAFSPPLNYNGSLGANAKTYADMINATTSGIYYKRVTFEQMAASDLGYIQHNKIFSSLVRCSLFVQADEIT